jgi:hypothetical protein
MSVDPKEAARKFVAEVSAKMPIQYCHDQFFMGALNRLRDRMDEANATINSKVEALLAQGDDNKQVQEQLSSVLRMSLENGTDEGVKDLQDMLSSRANIDSQLQALLGVVQYSILLAARIDVFRKILEIVADVDSSDLSEEEMRVKLLKYGPQLQYVWQKAFHECRSMDERQMFSKTIFGKDIKLGSEHN